MLWSSNIVFITKIMTIPTKVYFYRSNLSKRHNSNMVSEPTD